MGKLKVGFFPGVWDLVHPGHIRAIEEASQKCDYLIIGLQIDPSVDRKNKNKPILTYEERYEILSALKWVDWIWVYETEEELKTFDKNQRVDVRFMGADHKADKKYPTKAKIVYISRNHHYSSTELKNRIKNG